MDTYTGILYVNYEKQDVQSAVKQFCKVNCINPTDRISLENYVQL